LDVAHCQHDQQSDNKEGPHGSELAVDVRHNERRDIATLTRSDLQVAIIQTTILQSGTNVYSFRAHQHTRHAARAEHTPTAATRPPKVSRFIAPQPSLSVRSGLET
jgi:hypothetical protein